LAPIPGAHWHNPSLDHATAKISVTPNSTKAIFFMMLLLSAITAGKRNERLLHDHKVESPQEGIDLLGGFNSAPFGPPNS